MKIFRDGQALYLVYFFFKQTQIVTFLKLINRGRLLDLSLDSRASATSKLFNFGATSH